jgi:hypothetical protein
MNHKKRTFTRGIWIPLVLLAGSVSAGPVFFDTGVDDSRAILPDGAIDAHYSLIALGAPANAIATSSDPVWWVAPPAGSKWIGPSLSSQSDPAGEYIYTFEFTLADGDIGASATLSGLWAADNTSEIWLNGIFTGYDDGFLDALKAFDITNGFVIGVNTLEFKVENWPQARNNPSALLVSGLTFTNDPAIPAVPAPAGIVLGAIGAGLAGLLRRRRAL